MAILKFLVGPELIWVLIYALVASLASKNRAPDHENDKILENLHLHLPFAALMTFFWLWVLPFVPRNGLLLRVWISCLVLGHLALQRGLAAHSKQGPGTGTIYIVGMLLLLLALGAGSLFVWWWF